ncbi:MAG: glycosyl hydrolase 115 family protein [Duncaniella sp.]|nr:glycosyl hydrolase 115 family protein [Duncaniella sp.]
MAINFRKVTSTILLSFSLPIVSAGTFTWFDGTAPVSYAIETKTDLVVGTAAGMFESDMEAVTGKPAVTDKRNPTIRLTQLDKASKSQRRKLIAAGVPVESLDTLTDGFHISTDGKSILVVGSNGRGTAYGLLELSRMAGVSPWIWWGDMVPEKKERLELDSDFSITKGASVEYRGVFLNDEDWSLRPWSFGTYEPAEPGTIGPKTYKRIFELLMRLRGNAVWGAMHEGTKAFFSNPANKLVADSCGIAVGSSHCEPLLRNNVGEWDVKKLGRYNYMTNRDAVHSYWSERLDEVKNSQGGNIFTMGMRGIHDSSMEGVKTTDEKFHALQQVIDDQQKLIAEHVGRPDRQMQVFIPYKEVLELYKMGLNVPDYVTLMWCDDNYGYITRLSDDNEQKRPGGGGVYYHLSYWGRPHDHLWLTTTQPGLIYNEMRTAYDHNVRKLWIANVHDPKVAAYDLELFLDLAWDIDCVNSDAVGEHLNRWLAANFGEKAAGKLYPAMRKFYNLAAKRRPEFMGWSQVELDKRTFNRGLSPVANTEFSFTEFGNEADRYMEEYQALAATVAEVEKEISPELRDAYFAAIKYPVTSAANHAVKILESQRARSIASGSALIDPATYEPRLMSAVAKSQNAYQTIRKMTDRYNREMSGGKWDRSMNMRPRDLPVFSAPSLPVMLNDAEVSKWLHNSESEAMHPIDTDGAIARDAASFDSSEGTYRITDLLGHSNRAVALDKGSSLTYRFNVADSDRFTTLTTAVIPTQPSDDGDLRFSVSIDGGEPEIYSLKEPFRSEQWKKNVLRGQALRTLDLPALTPGEHTLTITAIDPHIIVDQWILDQKSDRKYYIIPTSAR